MVARLRALPDERIGDRFEILGEAGSGGMGTVYRARDHETGALVALKVLSAGGSHERFAEEALLLSRLRHDAIVAHVAHGATAAGEPFLAMEWLEGESLSQRLARDELALEESLALGARVADALAAAHQLGVVHRDIKPSNLFLAGGDAARVKVLDFGVARRDDRGDPLTKRGEILGTPGYMAPEQARGGAGGDPRADLFSLGCVLFRCLADRPAFAGDDVLAVLSQLATHEPPALDEIVEGIPPALAQLVARLMAKSPDGRPPSAAAVRAELLGIADGLDADPDADLATPERLHEVPPTRRSPGDGPSWATRSRLWPALVLALGALAFVLLRRSGEPLRTVIEQPPPALAEPRWSHLIGGDAARAVAVAVEQGAVYVALEANGPPRPPGEAVAAVDGLSPGGEDGEVAAFDARGQAAWKRRFHGFRDLDMLAIAASPERVVAGGFFHRRIESDDGRRAESRGEDGLFLAVVNRASGEVERLSGHGEADLALFLGKLALAADDGGAVVVAGGYGGSLDLGCGVERANGHLDAFIAKLDPDGSCRFMRRFGDDALQTFESVALDDAGHIIAAGEMSGTTEVGAERHESQGGIDVVVARFDPAGAPRWSRRFGNKGGLMGGVRVAAHPLGHILLAGWFEGALDFDGHLVTSDGPGHDLFVAKLDTAGAALWSRAVHVERAPCPVMSCRLDRIGLAADGEGGAVVVLPFAGGLALDDKRLTARATDVAVLRIDARGDIAQAAQLGDEGAQCQLPECVFAAAADRFTAALAGGFRGSLGSFGSAAITAEGEDAFVMALPP
jgi:hypothetical protein